MTASLKRKTRQSGASLNKAIRVLEVLKGVPDEQIQALLESGLLADLRDANYSCVDPKVRGEIRKMLGLKPYWRSEDSFA